jgi:hypothetical protein
LERVYQLGLLSRDAAFARGGFMGISFDAGPVAVGLSPNGDLAKFLTPGLNTVLHLGDTLKDIAAIPGAKLSDVPDGGISTSFAADREGAWDLGADVNVKLSFRPELSGVIRFTKTGPIATYLDGNGKTFDVAVPPNNVCVSIGFRVNLEVAGALAYSAGNFGVKANLTKDDVFLVLNHRCFPETTGVFDALGQAFSGFKLPFLPTSVAGLKENDLLEFEFIGKLSLGMGLTYGLGAVQLGGRSAGEISRSFGNDFAKAVVTAKPTVKAGAEFAVSYSHEDAFRFVFAREPRVGDNTVSLTIFRKDKASLQTKETLGVTVDAGLQFDFSSKVDQALDSAVNRLFENAGAAGNPQAADQLKQKLRTASRAAVKQLTTAINDGVGGLLKKASGTVQLQFLQEQAHVHTALFRLHFDLAAPGAMDGALRRATNGNIRDALAQPGVELEPGSMVEDAFIRRSSVGFQLFDLWKWNDLVEYVDQVDVVYAGKGMLRLIALEGVTHASGVVGHQSSCDVHFLAEAAEELEDSAVDKLKVSLHFVLLDRTAARIEETARLLRAFNDAAFEDPIAEIQRASSSGNIGVKTSCEFGGDAFRAFTADPYHGKKPGPMPHPNDARNYAQFADAVRRLSGQFLGFATYDEWAVFNRTAIDQEGGTRPPDRRQPGNLAVWPSNFVNVPNSQRDFMRFYSESGRHFMNLCEALAGLCDEIDEAETEAGFRTLLATLNGIVREDFPVDFIKATLLALINPAQRPLANVAAAMDGQILAVSFNVSQRQAAHA